LEAFVVWLRPSELALSFATEPSGNWSLLNNLKKFPNVIADASWCFRVDGESGKTSIGIEDEPWPWVFGGGLSGVRERFDKALLCNLEKSPSFGVPFREDLACPGVVTVAEEEARRLAAFLRNS
jgi:hypothetical protein